MTGLVVPRPLRHLALAPTLVLVLGCAQLGTDLPPIGAAGQADRILLRNGTSTPLTVVINGAPVGLLAAETEGRVSLLGRGGPPYQIELRTPSGRSVFDFGITLEDHRQVTAGQMSSGSGAATDCGWVEIAYGSDVFAPADPAAAMPTPGGICP